MKAENEQFDLSQGKQLTREEMLKRTRFVRALATFGLVLPAAFDLGAIVERATSDGIVGQSLGALATGAALVGAWEGGRLLVTRGRVSETQLQELDIEGDKDGTN